MTKKDFEKLKLHNRLELLSKSGEHLGVRTTDAYKVHLFACEGLFVEIYIIKGLEQVQWAEVQNNVSILQEYTKNLDLAALF